MCLLVIAMQEKSGQIRTHIHSKLHIKKINKRTKTTKIGGEKDKKW